MFGRICSFLGFGAPKGDEAPDLETRITQAERVQKLDLTDSVKKRRLDEIMRTPGTGSGTGGVTPMPRRALQLGSAASAQPKKAVKSAATGRGPALQWNPMPGSWTMQKSAIEWVVKSQPTAYVQKYARGNYIVFKCSGHIDCQAQIKITKDDVAENEKVPSPW